MSTQINWVETFKTCSKENVQVFLEEEDNFESIEDEGGNSLLHMACGFSHVDHVDYLIKRGADLNRLNKTGDSALMAACQDKCLKKVKYLVDIGCDLNHCDLHRANIHGMTALHFAAGYSTIAVVRYLLCNEINSFIRGSTGAQILLLFDICGSPLEHVNIPLHLACVFNPVDIMECVYHHNTSVVDPDDLFLKHLFHSCKEQKSHRAIFMINNKRILDLEEDILCGKNTLILVKHGTSRDVNISKGHVIAPAPYTVFNKELTHIRNHCRGINDTSRIGTILHIAARYYSLQVVQDLVSAGADYKMTDDVGMNALHLACHDQCLEKVSYFIDLGLDTKAADNAGFSPLHIAAQYSSTDIMQLLVQRGADIKCLNNNKDNVLKRACFGKSLQTVKFISSLDLRIDINTTDNLGYTALHTAAQNSSLEVVEFLIDQGANPYSTAKNGDTILHSACLSNYHPKAKVVYLMRYETLVNMKNSKDYTPLLIAAEFNTLSTVECLVNNGADVHAVNHKGDTALYRAAFSRSVPKLRYLIDKGLEINMPNTFGFIPLHASIEHSSLPVVQFLVSNGADINAETKDSESVLFWGCRSFLEDNVSYVLEKGAAVINKTSKHDDTSVLDQTLKRQFLGVNIIEKLVAKGMDINDGKSYAESYLFSALSLRVGLDCIKYLIEQHHFDVNAVNSLGETPIHAAARNNACPLDVGKYLISNGADINVKTTLGETILHSACKGLSEDIVRYFVKKGFDIHATDNNGTTPIQVAAETGCKEVVSLLLEEGGNLGDKMKTGDSLLHQICKCPSVGKLWFGLHQSCGVHDHIRVGSPPWKPLCRHLSYGTLKYLLNKLERVNDLVNDAGQSVLHVAVQHQPPNVIKTLLDQGVRHDLTDAKGDTPTHLAFLKGDLQAVMHLLRSGANMYATNSEGITPLAMCAGDSELRTYIIILHIESNMPLDNLYQCMKKWNPQASINEILWFCFAGGIPEKQVSLKYLPDISSNASLDILFASCPLYLRNNMGNVNTISHELPPDCKTVIDSYMNKFPTLATISRQCIRNLFSGEYSLLPQLKAMYTEEHITQPDFHNISLIEQMPKPNEKQLDFISKFLGREFQRKKSLYKHEQHPVSLKYLYHNTMDSAPRRKKPRWILDQLAGTCPFFMRTAKGGLTATDIESCDADAITRPISELLQSFLSQLGQADGSSARLKMCGSLHQRNQVSKIDEIDFVAVESFQTLHIDEDPTRTGSFVVKRLLGDDSHIDSNLKIYLCQALSYFLRREKRPDNPATGQVYVQACFSYPVAPAVCTVFAWQCAAGHRHELSVDLTPCIMWEGKHLKDVVRIPSFFSLPPFKVIKKELEMLTPMLVLSPTQHSIATSSKLNVVSNWRVSYSCTKDIIWRLLDSISAYIRIIFKYMKVARNVIYPYYIKFKPNNKAVQGSWQGGQVFSSWTLFNILLHKVRHNPSSDAWGHGQFRKRLLETLHSMLEETYEDFFTESRESSIKFPSLIKQMGLDMSISTNLTGIIQNIRSRSDRNRECASVVVNKVAQSCVRLQGKISILVGNPISDKIIESEDTLRFDTERLCNENNIVSDDKIFYFKMPVIDTKHDQELLEDANYIDLLHVLMSYFQERS